MRIHNLVADNPMFRWGRSVGRIEGITWAVVVVALVAALGTVVYFLP